MKQMKHILTLLLLVGPFSIISAQVNPGFFEMRLVNGSMCNRVLIQMRAISTVLPVHNNDDCQGLPFNGNTLNFDLTFTLFWTEPSITNAQDVLNLECASGGTGYHVVDVGGTGLLDLGGGIKGKGFANGAFTPLDFPITWPLNTWMDITEITMVNFNCELGSISSFVQISPFGMFTAEEDPNIAVNIPDEEGITDYTPAVEEALPLNLLSFEARKEGDRSAMLTWSTSDEVNISHFVVERSIDRINWTEVGKVQSTEENTQVKYYQFLDRDVYDARHSFARFYYRLKIEERDGFSKLSPVKVVLFESENGTARIYIYPNPATDGVNVELDNSREGFFAKEIVFYNNLGQLVYHQEIPEDSRIEFIDFRNTNINSGAYTIQVIDSGNGILSTEKLVVQR